eukprot:1421994-Pyramimonas_sp.AAC.1
MYSIWTLRKLYIARFRLVPTRLGEFALREPTRLPYLNCMGGFERVHPQAKKHNGSQEGDRKRGEVGMRPVERS